MEILYMQNILLIIVKLSQSKQLLIRVQLQKFCFHIVNCVHSVNISGGGTGGGGGGKGPVAHPLFAFFYFLFFARHHAERSGM